MCFKIGRLRYNHLILIWLILIWTMGLAVLSSAQTVPTPEQADNHRIAAGSMAKFNLETRLSSKLSEVGDRLTATVAEPVLDDQGRIAIPEGTPVFGRVTQVQAARRPQREATMTIVFETLRMSYGVERIATVVTAIDDFANDEKMKAQDEEGRVGAGKSGTRTARNAGLGGGLGALGGMIIGAAGGGLGAMAGAMGTGVLGGVLMTKGDDIRLNPGTILRVRFERDVTLPVFPNDPTSTTPLDGSPNLRTTKPKQPPEADKAGGQDR
jgi:hypothetical protein